MTHNAMDVSATGGVVLSHERISALMTYVTSSLSVTARLLIASTAIRMTTAIPHVEGLSLSPILPTWLRSAICGG